MSMSSGDGAAMWPKGVHSVHDCPNDLVMAVAHAQYILNTSGQLMEEEQPAMWKWAFPDELETHFERVKRERDKKYGVNSSKKDEEPPDGWAQNEYARNLR